MNPLGKGRRKQIRGRIREKIGKVRGDRKQQISGRLEHLEGTARLQVGKMARKVRKRLSNR